MLDAERGQERTSSESSGQHLLAAYLELVRGAGCLLPGFAKLFDTDGLVGLAEEIFSGQLLDILRDIGLFCQVSKT